MAKALKAVGVVAGVVALSLAIPGVGTGLGIGLTAASSATVSAIASAVAVAANTGAALLARKPGQQGSSTSITIGATMPSPCIIGESYAGGSRVKQVGYGTEDDVPNAHALIVDVYSVAGPLTALVSTLCDFVPVTFSGGDQNAVGYFHNNLHRFAQLGATPEASALAPHWTTSAPWGGSSKLSGKAAILWNARWPKNGKVFAAGFPQTGAIWQGVPAYDPRLDSTRPGGSGDDRWTDPVIDKVGFETAKATWNYTRCPGLHALRYALGSWERDEGTTNDYIKVFGVGLKTDQVVIEDFIGLANTCDLNGWTVNGEVLEGLGISKWDNLKRILAAGGAQPVWKGGRLGLSWNAPRIAADTITLDDIAEGEPVVPGTQPYEQRKNTLIPKWIDPASKWASVPSSPVQVTEWVAEDGEERSEEFVLDLVTNADQAAQLTGYELAGRREQGPITLPLKPRLRHYPPGALLAIDAAAQTEFGIREPDLLMTNRTVDPMAMSWVSTFVTDNADKHDYALGLTGTSPPTPTITSTEDRDGIAGASADRQVSIEVVGLKTFAADYTATINADLLPAYIVPQVKQGGSDIRISDDVAYSIATSAVTAAVNDTAGSADKGMIEITAVDGLSGWIDLTVTVSGVTYPAKRVVIQKQVGLAPSLGGAGSKIAADNSFEVISGTGFVPITDALTVTLATGETLYGTAPLSYDLEGTTGGTRTASGKWQYAVAGSGVWSDFAAAASSSPATGGFTPESGFAEFSQSKSGLSAGDYDVRLVAALDASGRNVIFSGTATIEAKV